MKLDHVEASFDLPSGRFPTDRTQRRLLIISTGKRLLLRFPATRHLVEQYRASERTVTIDPLQFPHRLPMPQSYQSVTDKWRNHAEVEDHYRTQTTGRHLTLRGVKTLSPSSEHAAGTILYRTAATQCGGGKMRGEISLCTWGATGRGGEGVAPGYQSMRVLVWMRALAVSTSFFFWFSHCFAPNDWLHLRQMIRVLSSVSCPPCMTG